MTTDLMSLSTGIGYLISLNWSIQYISAAYLVNLMLFECFLKDLEILKILIFLPSIEF